MPKHRKTFGLTDRAVRLLSRVVESLQMDPEVIGCIDVSDVVSASLLAFHQLTPIERRRFMLLVGQEIAQSPPDA